MLRWLGTRRQHSVRRNYLNGTILYMETLVLFITVAGFIIGLGAVTVIDTHGFFGRRSSYWTEATTRTHKITKPLIWIGMVFVLLGTVLALHFDLLSLSQFLVRLFIIISLIINGCFLSFVVSPALIKREKEGKAGDLLPVELKRNITISFVVSFVGWWSLVYLFVSVLTYA